MASLTKAKYRRLKALASIGWPGWPKRRVGEMAMANL